MGGVEADERGEREGGRVLLIVIADGRPFRGGHAFGGQKGKGGQGWWDKGEGHCG